MVMPNRTSFYFCDLSKNILLHNQGRSQDLEIGRVNFFFFNQDYIFNIDMEQFLFIKFKIY